MSEWKVKIGKGVSQFRNNQAALKAAFDKGEGTIRIGDGPPLVIGKDVHLAEPYVYDPMAEALSEYYDWLERNADAPCTCGHEYRRHLADLTACADCVEQEPVHLRCDGFNLDRTELA